MNSAACLRLDAAVLECVGGSDNSDDGAECSESVGQMEDRDYQNALVVNVMRWLAYLNFSSLV